ncbi:MAG: hypothetical protein Q9210_003714 [Variospora velana]
MSFFARLGNWLLWVLLAANTSVFAASTSNPLLIASQLANAEGKSVRIQKLDPSPELQRQFEAARPKLSTPKPSVDHLLTEDDFDEYHIEVTGSEVIVDIRVDNSKRLPALSVQRLLGAAMTFCLSEIREHGRDTPVTMDYQLEYPPGPAIHTVIDVGRDSHHFTYGVAFDGLRGIVQFRQANPAANGELVALIKIPRLGPGDDSIVGYVSFFEDDDDGPEVPGEN